VPSNANNFIQNVSKAAHSKNVSFFLNENQKKETSIQNKSAGNESKQQNESDMSVENFKYNNNINNRQTKTTSAILNEQPKANISDIDNNNNNNKILISDSNKNVNLISAFNNNIPSQIPNENYNEKYNSNNNYKIQLGLVHRNTLQNNENNDFEITNIKSKWEAMKQSVISTTSNNNLRMFKDENFLELKLAKKETILYKNCFDSITTDYKKLKSCSKNFEKILSQNLENYTNLKEAEIVKFAKALEMYNELYLQQIKLKDIKIKQLSILVDQLAEKEISSLKNNLNKRNLTSSFEK